MKNRSLLPIVFLSTFCMIGSVALGACTQQSEKSQYAVAIANKEELQAKFYTDDNQRALTINLTPEGNALAELQAGTLTITSSAPTIISVTGLGLNPLAPGKAVITANYHGSKDSVEIEVSSANAKDRYQTAHAGTAEDPFTNEDAIKVAKHDDYQGQDYYVQGEIASWYHTPGERSDGKVSWYLKPAQAGGEQFEMYMCTKEDGTALTDNDIWKGGIATAHGPFTVYNNTQCETTSAKFVSCTGTKPAARATNDATVAQAVTAGKALVDGDSAWDYYNITGYVVKKSGDSYYLNDTAEVASSDKDMFQLYNAKAEGLPEKLLKNAKVTVKAVIKNYHDQVETCLPLVANDVTVLTAGEPWVINYQDKTVAEALTIINGLADGATADGYYAVTGYVKAVTGAYSAQYGNMNFTIGDTADATDLLTCFRVKTDAETAAKVVAGAKVVVKGQLQKYVKDGAMTPELINSSSVEVIPTVAPTYVSLAKYTFTTQTAENTRSIDAAGVKAIFTKAAGEDIFDEATNVTNVYEGANGGSGDTAWKLFNILKIAKSKTAGELTFKTKQDVAKIVLKGGAVTATATVTVNNKAVETAFKDNLINKAAIGADGKLSNPGTIEFEFSATKTITIAVTNSNANANFSVAFVEMELFGVQAA